MNLSLVTWRRLLFAGLACTVTMQAQQEYSSLAQLTATPATGTAYALFQYAILGGSGNSIAVSRVPVINSSGVTIYKDITLTFQVDSSGNLSVAAGSPVIVNAPVLITSVFKPGKYLGPSNVLGGNAIVNVAGPGVTSGGATEWTSAAASGSDGCTYPATASWYVGPLSANPIAPRLTAAKITSTAWSYGVGSSECYNTNGWFANNALIGFSQVSNTITIVNFTDGSGVDHNVPQQQITFTAAQ